jgi:hypothetical protein
VAFWNHGRGEDLSTRAFELLLCVIEELVEQLGAKGVIDATEIMAIVATARREWRRW